jgi:MSHA biogenesis protein MshO
MSTDFHSRRNTEALFRAAQRGFTMIEAIIVIVITGIVGAIVVAVLKWPVANYSETRIRAELTDMADLSIRRMTRELRLALPNSVRISANQQTISFLLVKTGGRYMSVDDNAIAGTSILDFTNATALNFTVVGTMPAGRETIVAGDSIVVYNLGPGFAPANAYTGGNIATVGAVAGNLITLTTNPFGLQDPGGLHATTAFESPTKRFQVVSTPVMYDCNPGAGFGNGTLKRYSGYPIAANEVIPPTAAGTQSALVTSNISACQFDFARLANLNSGLVSISLTLQRPSTTQDGPVTLTQQVHIDSTP